MESAAAIFVRVVKNQPKMNWNEQKDEREREREGGKEQRVSGEMESDAVRLQRRSVHTIYENICALYPGKAQKRSKQR